MVAEEPIHIKLKLVLETIPTHQRPNRLAYPHLNDIIFAMLISIVIPVFNEAGNIPKLWQRLSEVTASLEDYRFEIVFVDDNSTDQTCSLIGQLRGTGHTSWQLVHLSRNFGHQAAISAGILHSKGDALFFIDADLQDPPELLPDFLRKYEEGYDVVYGVRKNRKEFWVLRFCFSAFYRLFNLMAENNIPRDAGDFSLISRRVADLISNMPEQDRMIRCLRSWVGFKQAGIAYNRPPRHSGESHYGLRRRIEGALDAIFGYSKLPIRLAALLGCTVVLIGFVYLAWVYIGWLLLGGKPVPGWTSIITLGFIVAGANIITTSIVGEYCCRVYFQAKSRPLFIVDHITSSTENQPTG